MRTYPLLWYRASGAVDKKKGAILTLGCFPRLTQERNTTFVEIDAPADLLRHIIGKGGQNVTRLRKVCVLCSSGVCVDRACWETIGPIFVMLTPKMVRVDGARGNFRVGPFAVQAK